MSGAEPTRRAVVARGTMLAAASLIGQHARAASGSVVRSPAGDVQGEADGGVRVFRGIRYGRAKRFLPPVGIATPGRPVLATTFGPVCPQTSRRYRPQSEDCLFLNVWTAEPNPGARRPVMVYIHGGAHANGSVTDPLNDGRHLAARGDVVVVTVNHRLNAFGYLYLARLDPSFPDSGNTGQLDLILALRWVRDNIAAFGGDPSRVTVFGQSGGGAKIATMMAMPAAKGLFHRAITMSGQQVTASGPLNATARARAYLARLKVSERDLSPLLALPPERLVEALDTTDPILGGPVYMGPVLDMRSLVRHPMILGNTREETGAFVAPDTLADLTWDTLAERLTPQLRIDVPPEWIVARYRAHEPGWSPTRVFYAASTAGRSWPGQLIEAEARARAGAPVRVYQLDFASRTDPRKGAFHAHEIPLVFGTLDGRGSETGTGADARVLAQAMQDRFVAFAAAGVPGAGWPSYDLTGRATMIFDTTVRVENDPCGWQRELFARAPYVHPGS